MVLSRAARRVNLNAQAQEEQRAVAAAVRATGNAQATSAADILSLQRTAGNRGVTPLLQRVTRVQGGLIQRDLPRGGGRVSVRSPAFEEAATQISDIIGESAGRPLEAAEIAVARPIFGRSLDYARVRLIPTSVLEYRTVGNNIRVPLDFTMGDSEMAQYLVHELTHVWQYQHTGTSYLSASLADQIAGSISAGGRGGAYQYRLSADSSFFDFRVEQQAEIVENTFAMLRDRRARRNQPVFASNHMDAQGNRAGLTYEERQAEITAELPNHLRVVAQMRRSMPQPEVNLLQQRAQDVMVAPSLGTAPVPRERELIPTRPLLEIRF